MEAYSIRVCDIRPGDTVTMHGQWEVVAEAYPSMRGAAVTVVAESGEADLLVPWHMITAYREQEGAE